MGREGGGGGVALLSGAGAGVRSIIHDMAGLPGRICRKGLCIEHSPIVTLICTAKEDGDEVLDTFEFGYYSNLSTIVSRTL